jgi:hypothetical protein
MGSFSAPKLHSNKENTNHQKGKMREKKKEPLYHECITPGGK